MARQASTKQHILMAMDLKPEVVAAPNQPLQTGSKGPAAAANSAFAVLEEDTPDEGVQFYLLLWKETHPDKSVGFYLLSWKETRPDKGVRFFCCLILSYWVCTECKYTLSIKCLGLNAKTVSLEKGGHNMSHGTPTAIFQNEIPGMLWEGPFTFFANMHGLR